ncbi:MAG: hypothetical protein LUP97_02735 [Methanoregula sp.]|nr:hypothetical protein [Methanoregula sp.]
MIITDLENTGKAEEICDECPSPTARMIADGEKQSWESFPYEFLYPAPVSHRSVSILDSRKTRSSDPMLISFTSGTTGEPQMVLHNNGYALGHLHFPVSNTGWAKCAWGKIFGQWIEGACNFAYLVDGRFQATEAVPLFQKYQVTTFCCRQQSTVCLSLQTSSVSISPRSGTAAARASP